MSFVYFKQIVIMYFDCSVSQLGGIVVDVNPTEHSTVIRFSEYHDGAAPFLIINHTRSETLQFFQRYGLDKAEVTRELTLT